MSLASIVGAAGTTVWLALASSSVVDSRFTSRRALEVVSSSHRGHDNETAHDMYAGTRPEETAQTTRALGRRRDKALCFHRERHGLAELYSVPRWTGMISLDCHLLFFQTLLCRTIAPEKSGRH